MSSERGGVLYLVPSTLGEVAPDAVIPAAVVGRIRSLRHFIAENEKSARAFLKRVEVPCPLRDLSIQRLDHNTPAARLPELLAPVEAGQEAGPLSPGRPPAGAGAPG